MFSFSNFLDSGDRKYFIWHWFNADLLFLGFFTLPWPGAIGKFSSQICCWFYQLWDRFFCPSWVSFLEFQNSKNLHPWGFFRTEQILFKFFHRSSKRNEPVGQETERHPTKTFPWAGDSNSVSEGWRAGTNAAGPGFLPPTPDLCWELLKLESSPSLSWEGILETNCPGWHEVGAQKMNTVISRL